MTTTLRQETGELATYVKHVRDAARIINSGVYPLDWQGNPTTKTDWEDDLRDALQVIIGTSNAIAERFNIDL